MAQVDEGYTAVRVKEFHSRRRLIETLQKSAMQAFRDAAAPVDGFARTILVSEWENASNAPENNFEALCDDLSPAGVDAYAVFRSMSMEDHASVLLADRWLDPPEEGDESGGSLRLLPREDPDGPVWMHIVGAFLVWAGRVVDFFDR
ncbi:hypothetical protein [Arthrobacter sp. NEB 688]|uniref:hypothetical protein n=1 Tax=Arthrobacter sp. NEB 688 TaxID=904039 RepID=UPI0015635961|nr:hypothetical protein [Arthrobacter sp. NEB 688]QKE85153.1 hypothetical protein HL663_15220 [Arthrobacter sp. NEB 688]